MSVASGAARWLAATLLLGCGSRTTLSAGADAGRATDDAGTVIGVDAGAPSDPRDAGTSICTLTPLGDPVVVLDAAGGPYEGPFVQERAGGLDLGASLRVGTGALLPQGRRARVEADGAVTLTGDVQTGERSMVTPARFAARGDLLGGCITFPDALELHAWRGEVFERVGSIANLPGGRCMDMAAGPSAWLVAATREGPDADTVVGVLPDLGEPPTVLFELGPGLDRPAAATTATRGGFVIAFSTEGGRLRLVRVEGAAITSDVELRGFRTGFRVPPGLADWSGAEEAVAVASYADEILTVVRVTSDGAEDVAVDLGLGGGADTTPAVVSGPFGLVVGAHLYDPGSGGSMRVTQVDATGAREEIARLPVSREGRQGAVISAARVGDRVVFHWSDATDGARTFAWVFGCVS